MSRLYSHDPASRRRLMVFRSALLACLLLGAAGLGQSAAADDDDLDPDFAVGSGTDGDVDALALQLDGRIVVGGAFTSVNGVARNRVARLMANGRLDRRFVGPVFSAGDVEALAVQPDGKILVGGTVLVNNNDRGIFRLTADGRRDTQFNRGGSGIIGTVEAIVVQPDGKILVGGNFDTYNGSYWHNIIRLNSDGSIDTSFAIGAGFSDAVFSLALQTDGKIVAGGRFTFFNGTHRNYIARLNANGSLDTGFEPGPGFDGGFDHEVYSLAIQPDGRIVVGGAFVGFDSGMPNTRNFIARLEADGDLDTTFDPDRGFNNSVDALAIQPNGRIFAGGGFTSFIHGDNTTTPRGFIARVLANGSLGSFADTRGFDSVVNAMAFQPDGGLVVAGRFTAYDGLTRNHIVRLRGYTGNVFPITVNGTTVDDSSNSQLVVSNPVDVSFTLDGVTPPAEIFAALNAPRGIHRSFLTANETWVPLPTSDWTRITPWAVQMSASDTPTTLYHGNLPRGTYDLILGFDSELDGYFSFGRSGVTVFYRHITLTVQ